jgi:serine protease AprX
MFHSRAGSGARLLAPLLVVLLLTTLFLSHGGSAVANSAGDTLVVRMNPSDWSRAASELQPIHALDYGTFVWVELNVADFARLQAGNVTYEVQPDAFELVLGEQRFDPLQGPPQVATGWDKSSAGGPDLHLVQFIGPPRPEWLDTLESQNLEIVQYIFPNSYVVWGEHPGQKTQSVDFVRWSGPFLPAYRVLPQWQELSSSLLPVNVLIYRGSDADNVVDRLEKEGGRLYGRSVLNDTWEVAGFVIHGDRLQAAAHVPGVYSIQPLPTDGGNRGEMSNQINVNNHNASNLAFPGYATWLSSVGLNGSGVIIANVDTGIQDSHPDLVNRLIPCTGVTCGGAASSSHGTHTAAIMAGDGASGVVDSFGFLRGQGVAPGANLVEQVYGTFYNQPGGMLLLMTESFRNGASLSGNSWGPAGTPQGYNNHTLQVDIGVRDADPAAPGNQAFSFVLSIMNGNGGTSSQGSPDEAKNIFTIGSTKMQNTNGTQILEINDLSSNTAHGPALDGRKIPHMVAPGCRVDSASTGSGYALLCGTSMASPHVSGAVALFIEYYRNLHGVDPSPALIKAAFLPVAHNLAGFRDANNGILGHPFDSKQGWGRMDLDAVVNPQVDVHYFDDPMLFTATGEEWTQTVHVIDPTKPLRVMLVWTDAPGHGLGGSTPAWNNDLDLVVEMGGNSYRGNHFGSDGWSQTGGSADFRNNTEGVFVGPTASGSATIRVLATNINSDGVPGNGIATDQDFALVCYNCTTLLNPSELHVYVQDSEQEPIAGATIVADDGENTWTATTNAAGSASLFVEVGDYDVTAWAFGYLAETIPVSTDPDSPTSVTFTLETATLFSLSGTVTDQATGAGLRFVDVEFTNAPPATQTDSDGFYSLTVPEGNYFVKFDGPLHAALTVEVFVDQPTVLNVELVATTTDGLLYGYVYSANTNQPVAGAAVAITGGGTAVTDSDGYYTIQNAPGVYTVSATAPLYGVDEQSDIVVEQSNLVRQDFYLPAAWLQLSPDSTMTYLALGDTTTLPLTISNPGGHELSFEIIQWSSAFTPDSAGRTLAILLVNDTNGNATNPVHYTTALTSLGYSFDVFTVTGSGNGPSAGQMSGYDLVIWFSGAAFGGTTNPIAGPNAYDEGQLATYLDGGGRLLLSSQDYYYDRGQSVNSFMSNYLGVATVTNDVQNLASVNGVNDFTALGPYNLTSVGTDWSDRMTGNASGSAIFVDSLDRTAGLYTEDSIFLAFMWEAIQNNNAANGEEALDAMIRHLVGSDIPWLTVDPESGVVPAGDALEISLGFSAEEDIISETGIYTGVLRVTSNDPELQQVDYIVTMIVVEEMFEATLAKEASATIVLPGDAITYTLSRELLREGNNSYAESILDQMPDGVTILVDTIEMNGVLMPELYDPAQNAIVHSWSDDFSDVDTYTISYQVQVDSGVISGTLLLNTYQSWISLNEAPVIGPFATSATVQVRELTSYDVDVSVAASSNLVLPGEIFTYTLARELLVDGFNNYQETIWSAIPAEVVILVDTLTLNGVPAPELYDANDNAISYTWSGNVTDSDAYEISFQVQVGTDVVSGTLIANTFESWISVNDDPVSGPFTAGAEVLVDEAVVEPPPVEVSLTKEASETTVMPGDVITYTIVRQLSHAGAHTFAETILDEIPDGLIIITDTIRLNGVPMSGIYDPAQNAISHSFTGSFEDEHVYTLTYQVVVGEGLASGTNIANTFQSWISIDGGDADPFTATAEITVVLPPVYRIFLPLISKP